MSKAVQSSEGSVVLRLVVYGPAGAGKTATAIALGEGLGQTVISPESLPGEPTVYFDWLEYVDGRHDGKPIRTQLITVSATGPATARISLLLSADVVLFVVDTSPGGIEASVASLAEARSCLEALGVETAAAAPSIIIQANKRDHEQAITLDELRTRLGLAENQAIVETVASQDEGVRQAFVCAVRVGLDHVGRVGERVETDQSPEELLAALALVNDEGPIDQLDHVFVDEDMVDEDMVDHEGFTIASVENFEPSAPAAPTKSSELIEASADLGAESFS